MKRRDFITLLGGAAAAWPLAARAQNVGMRRVIVLMGTADDAEAKDRAVALQEGLQKLRWTVGRDLQINYLFAAGSAERLLAYANEAVASKPDILLAQTNPAVKALQNVTRTLPIVFLQVSDPVGAGFVGSLAHHMLIAFSRAKSLPTFQFKSRLSTSWSSISKPPTRLD